MIRGLCERLALLAGGLAASLLIAEVALRVAGYSHPALYDADLELGWAPRPGAEGWYRDEGAAYIRNNSAGFRDREHAVEKPVGTLRVAVLGDSYAEALQIPMEEAFWSVAERNLVAHCGADGHRVEVLNFGVSGYGTGQELLLLRKRVWAYQPDVVLLAFVSGNDLTDNAFAFGRKGAPYFVRSPEGLRLDTSHNPERRVRWRSRWFRATDYSRLLQLVEEVRLAYKRRGEGGLSQPLSGSIYRQPVDANWREAWALTEELILTMNREVRAHGARFLLVTLSNGAQVLPDPREREAFRAKSGAEDLAYPDRRLETLAKGADIPFLKLAPELARYAETHRTYVHGFAPRLGTGHWNAEGHRLAGELIARALCPLLEP